MTKLGLMITAGKSDHCSCKKRTLIKKKMENKVNKDFCKIRFQIIVQSDIMFMFVCFSFGVLWLFVCPVLEQEDDITIFKPSLIGLFVCLFFGLTG